MRATTLLNRVLDLPGVRVVGVPACDSGSDALVVQVALSSRWRHLDAGRWRVELLASLRRLSCPEHGVVVESVPFARPRSGFTRDVEDVAA